MDLFWASVAKDCMVTKRIGYDQLNTCKGHQTHQLMDDPPLTHELRVNRHNTGFKMPEIPMSSKYCLNASRRETW